MNNAVLKQHENKNAYDYKAYAKFYSDLQNGKANWDEFLPTPSENINEAVVLRLKNVNDEVFGHIHLPNTKLYMLKNEYKNGSFFGFSCTTFFEYVRDVSLTKADWFKPENKLRVYVSHLENQQEVNIVEFQYSDEEERLTLLKKFINLAHLIGKTNHVMHRWNLAQDGKYDKQQVIKRFGTYLDNMLRASGVELYTSNSGKLDTQYHAFHLVEKSASFDDLLMYLAAFNINFETMVEGFEEFFVTFNCNDIDREKTTARKIARPIYVN